MAVILAGGDMHNYQKILVALDLYSSYEIVLARGLQIVSKPTGVSLIYVTMPQVYFEPYGAAFGADFISDIQQQASSRFKEIGQKHGIPESQLYTPIGSPADEIHTRAKQMKAELIVIGTHGKSGLKLLLGSTANAVLHGVKCDVLAVKV